MKDLKTAKDRLKKGHLTSSNTLGKVLNGIHEAKKKIEMGFDLSKSRALRNKMK